MNDTIVAISTALGVGAISIIRLSGENSISIANKIFKGKDLNKVKTHTIHYGHITENQEIIDEVLVSVMRSPKTYTKEDIVEINCHGGIATTNKVLELLLTNGARLAEPGEFTKRAFLNGRIDLIEADGIMNLISSKTEASRKISINELNGKTSSLIKDLRNELIKIISNIEVNIDYPEYEDIEILTNEKILPEINKIKEKLNKIITQSNNGRIINEGINIGIIGRPNVGKSSLLNSLLEENKAIVTDIEGTTRDIVEGKIILNGVLLNIIDTAGIRNTNNVVEKIGVEKSYNIIKEADLIIFLLNNNDILTNIDLELYDRIKEKLHIVVVNKIDLEKKIDLSPIKEEVIEVSLINKNVESILNKIKELFNLEKLETKDLTYLSNARSIALLKEARKAIDNAIKNIKENAPIDIVELELNNAWKILGEIIGETYTDELLDEMFKRFCLGK